MARTGKVIQPMDSTLKAVAPEVPQLVKFGESSKSPDDAAAKTDTPSDAPADTPKPEDTEAGAAKMPEAPEDIDTPKADETTAEAATPAAPEVPEPAEVTMPEPKPSESSVIAEITEPSGKKGIKVDVVAAALEEKTPPPKPGDDKPEKEKDEKDDAKPSDESGPAAEAEAKDDAGDAEGTEEKPRPVAEITEPTPGPITKQDEAPAQTPGKPLNGPGEASETPQPSAAERDPEAALSSEEAAVLEAQNVREYELEQLAASGKFYVPINAVQRHRSRMFILALCCLALLLGLLLLDAALDAGLVTLPVDVPHTHLFVK